MDTFHLVKESDFHAENKEPVPCGIQGSDRCIGPSGTQAESLAREFEPCVATIHAWINQANINDGNRAAV